MEQRKNNWKTEKATTYFDVRVATEPKYFPKSDEKPAALFVSFFDQSGADGEDVFVSARVIRGADTWKAIAKGDRFSVSGPVLYSKDKDGRIKGTIYDVVSFVPANKAELIARREDTTADSPFA